MFVIGHFHGNPVSSRRESLNDPFKSLQVFVIPIDMNMVALLCLFPGQIPAGNSVLRFPRFSGRVMATDASRLWAPNHHACKMFFHLSSDKAIRWKIQILTRPGAYAKNSDQGEIAPLGIAERKQKRLMPENSTKSGQWI
jgi:hypothetical protein